jgi:hypothetical protein
MLPSLTGADPEVALPLSTSKAQRREDVVGGSGDMPTRKLNFQMLSGAF